MIRLVATDMDGTLLDERSQVPPETYGLVRELAEVGVGFCVCSGRAASFVRRLVEPIADCVDLVCANGTFVSAGGEVLARHPYDAGEVGRLAALAAARHPGFHLNAVGSDGREYVVDGAVTESERAEWGWSARRVLEGPPPEGVDMVACARFCPADTDVLAAADELEAEMGDVFHFLALEKPVLDVVPRGVSKATGLQLVMEARGVSADEVVAYGDSMNDQFLFDHAGHPTAVENAYDQIKELAERVIASNVDHGVQRDMRRMLDDIRAGGDGLGGTGGLA